MTTRLTIRKHLVRHGGLLFLIANQSWPLVLTSIEWFQANDLKKKLWLDEVKFSSVVCQMALSNAGWDTTIEWMAIRYI